MEFGNVLVNKEGAVASVVINRPEALNALNEKVILDLTRAFMHLETDHDVKVVVLTGAGKSFIAGADIKAMSEMTSLQARHFAKLGHGLLAMIEESRLTVIAAVNGFALGGGCEVMMACDVVIASSKAKVGQPEINLGICPGFGGTQRLPRLIGRMRAKELLLTGDTISARQAFDLGLVNRVVEPEEFEDAVKEFADKIAEKSGVQLAFIKNLVNRGADIDLISANGLEIATFSSSFSTHDQKEGMKAFIEKRKADFKDE